MTTRPTSSRRRFLIGLLAATSGVLPAAFRAQAAEALPKLAEDDPAAKALGYVTSAAKAEKDPAFKKGSTCANCALYDIAKEQGGHAPCAALPGKVVAKGGWCRVWAARPA